MEMQKLRNEKLKIENENERLSIAIKVKSDNIDNMKHIYEESIHEQDKLVDWNSGILWYNSLFVSTSVCVSK
jgi:hypothetical protein